MDYEKKYNEAMNDMRLIYPNLKGDAKLAVEHAFPELRESEDERIRSCIGLALTDVNEKRFKDFGITLKDCLSWLEKQKEQKPAEWSEEDDIIRIARRCAELGEFCIPFDRISRIKSIRPSWKPSEDQMDALKELIDDANKAGWVTPGATELYEQLKKL